MEDKIRFCFLFLMIFLLGCLQNGFDEKIICERILSGTSVEADETVVGTVCSETVKQNLSPSQQEEIQKTGQADILNENTLIEFSCTVKMDSFGKKSYALNYINTTVCENEKCQNYFGENKIPQATCGERKISFCSECNDNNPCTLDSCKTSAEKTECFFIPRCSEGFCKEGICQQEIMCGNGVCESFEDSTSCPDDCRQKISCQNGGFTGTDVAPKNKFEWRFSKISANECDIENPQHINCDYTQALISFFQKMHLLEEQWNTNRFSETIAIPEVGKATATENGISLEYESAFLSDNFSHMLLWDFGHKEASFFEEPTWYLEKWKHYLPENLDNYPIKIEYKSPSINYFNPIQPAGIYKVKVEVRFKDNQKTFFSSNKVPNADIKIILERSSDLTDSVVLDLAFNGNLGAKDPFRDYGVQLIQNEDQKPVIISNNYFVEGSGIYNSGLKKISLLDSKYPMQTVFPSFYKNFLGIGGDPEAELFFNNQPMIMQITETTETLSTEFGESKDTEYSLAYNSLSALPMIAFVPQGSAQGFGIFGAQQNYGFFGPWAEIARQTDSCKSTVAVFPEPKSCGEIAQTSENGLKIVNDSTNNKIYFNVLYSAPESIIETSHLRLCNTAVEVSTRFNISQDEGDVLAIKNPNFSVSSLEELIENIKNEKACVFTQTISTGAQETKKTTYVFNTQALLETMAPQINQYIKNPNIGSFRFCS